MISFSFCFIWCKACKSSKGIALVPSRVEHVDNSVIKPSKHQKWVKVKRQNGQAGGTSSRTPNERSQPPTFIIAMMTCCSLITIFWTVPGRELQSGNSRCEPRRVLLLSAVKDQRRSTCIIKEASGKQL